MIRKENAIKKWYKLARPHKGRFFLQMLTAVGADLFVVVEPIFAANVITSLTIGATNAAYMWLAIAFVALFARNLLWDINYRLYSKLVGSSYFRIHEQIFDRLINAKEKNFKNTSREKLLNIVGSDIATVSYLSDIFCTKFSRLFRIVITIVIVFTNDIVVGLLIIAVSIANYFILNWINTNSAKYQKQLLEANEGIFEKLNEVVTGRTYIKDQYLDSNIHDEYKARGAKWLKAKHKQTIWQSARVQWHFVFWSFAVMLVSMYLVHLVSNGLPLAIYLMLIPYFTASMEKLSDIFNVTNDIKNTDVAVDRINTILNFEESEAINFGGYTALLESGDLAFDHVSAKSTSEVDGVLSRISDVSFQIKKGTIALFLGDHTSGKRAIFDIMRRTLAPKKGAVRLDGINIFDFHRSVYKSKINYTSAKPFFLEGSLLKNFLSVESDMEEVFKTNRMLGLHSFILKLPQGYNTNINKNLDRIPADKCFLIGLACALLAKSSVLMIYDIPIAMNDKDYEKTKSTLRKMAKIRSILIFSANKRLLDIATTVYNVDEGRVKLVSSSAEPNIESTSISEALENVNAPILAEDALAAKNTEHYAIDSKQVSADAAADIPSPIEDTLNDDTD